MRWRVTEKYARQLATGEADTRSPGLIAIDGNQTTL
jgi:hypothetical protein